MTAPSASRVGPQEVEVAEKARRRRFSAEFKLRVLGEVAAATRPGEIGAILRREGLYSSHIVHWKKVLDEGSAAALAPKKRGPAPKAAPPDSRDRRIAELERELVKAQLRAKRAEALVELQKKVSELLGLQPPESDENKS